jgi:hypothetical protein
MTPSEFEQYVNANPALRASLQSVAADLKPRVRGVFTSPMEIAGLALLFPLVSFIIKKIGLPWLISASKFSELWRLKFDNWVDEQVRKHGATPEQLTAAGEKIRTDLESLSNGDVKQVWEALAERLKKE